MNPLKISLPFSEMLDFSRYIVICCKKNIEFFQQHEVFNIYRTAKKAFDKAQRYKYRKKKERDYSITCDVNDWNSLLALWNLYSCELRENERCTYILQKVISQLDKQMVDTYFPSAKYDKPVR